MLLSIPLPLELSMMLLMYVMIPAGGLFMFFMFIIAVMQIIKDIRDGFCPSCLKFLSKKGSSRKIDPYSHVHRSWEDYDKM